ncbi:hypothetical protein G6F31_018102 [Rhizopus arrhizus]|nr:hypothetical protein G6F31_018102 [Rhizopus arrhizus]
MITLLGLQAGTMLGGSVVVESVFALPGLGRLAYESVVQRDLNTLLGIVFVSALLSHRRAGAGAAGAGVRRRAGCRPVVPEEPAQSRRQAAAMARRERAISAGHRPGRARHCRADPARRTRHAGDRAGGDAVVRADRRDAGRGGRLLRRGHRRPVDAGDGSLPDPAQLPVAAGAGAVE